MSKGLLAKIALFFVSVFLFLSPGSYADLEAEIASIKARQAELAEEWCKYEGILASDIMIDRQNGVPIDIVLKENKKMIKEYLQMGEQYPQTVKLIQDITLDAYDTYLFSTKSMKLKTVSEFRNKYHVACLKRPREFEQNNVTKKRKTPQEQSTLTSGEEIGIVNIINKNTLKISARNKEMEIPLYGIFIAEVESIIKSMAAGRKTTIEGMIDADSVVTFLIYIDGICLNEILINSGYAKVDDERCGAPFCSRWKVMEMKAKQMKKSSWK